MNTTLTKKFIDEMKIYQQSQQKYKTDIKNKVKRQVQVVKPDATDEEVDDIMKSDGGRDALYRQSILAGGVNDQIKYVLSSTTEKSLRIEVHTQKISNAVRCVKKGNKIHATIHFIRFHLISAYFIYLLPLPVRTTYAKVAGKYQDVLTLEQSVAELHQMFLDFALLTEQQGELLDQIEFNVTQATDYVEEANVETHQAIEYQKSIRKKQWYGTF